MDVFVFDTDFNDVGIADVYDSLIWTDRYSECGDFELCTSATLDLISLFQPNYYLRMGLSEHVMIIERVEIDSEVENGNRLIVSGRSLESILDRRIIWGQKNFENRRFELALQDLLKDCITESADTNRIIPNFRFSIPLNTIPDLGTITAQYCGENLYDVIMDLCKSRGIGFKITLNSNNEFVFRIYKGADRSYSQSDNPYVVFSPGFDNLISSNYFYSNEKYKNAALVGGGEPANIADLLDFENTTLTRATKEGSKDSYTVTATADGATSYILYIGLTENIGKTVYLNGSLERLGTHTNQIAMRKATIKNGTATWSDIISYPSDSNKVEMVDYPIAIPSGIDSYQIAIRAGRAGSVGGVVKVNGLKLYASNDRRIYASVGSSSGLDRRELFVDASGTSEDGGAYATELATKGELELANQNESIGFEGKADMSQQFVYGTDFAIGDIVQLDDGYGHYGSVVISEIVISENESGVSTFPTFQSPIST